MKSIEDIIDKEKETLIILTEIKENEIYSIAQCYEYMDSDEIENSIKRIAKKAVNASLEEAAEKAKMKIKNSNITFIEYHIPHKDMPLIIDKQSILSLKR